MAVNILYHLSSLGWTVRTLQDHQVIFPHLHSILSWQLILWAPYHLPQHQWVHLRIFYVYTMVQFVYIKRFISYVVLVHVLDGKIISYRTGPKGVKRFYRWISLQSISSSSNIFTIQFIPDSGRIRSISSSSNIFTIQFIPNSSRIQSTSSPKPMWVLFQKHITAFYNLNLLFTATGCVLGDPLGEHVALDGVPQWKMTAKETSVTKASSLALNLMVFFFYKRGNCTSELYRGWWPTTFTNYHQWNTL